MLIMLREIEKEGGGILKKMSINICALWVCAVNLKHLSLEMSFSIKRPRPIYISCIQVNLWLPRHINHCQWIAVSVPQDITLALGT